MTQIPSLGLLETVDLRQAWAHEAQSFTPWLAENLNRLSAALGIPLELEGQEVSVGSFSADLLARNPQDGSLVLIENQLEQTDHNHLGQILTYLAGLQAQVIVWIASDFRDPHLSAIHWLNDHTVDPFAFFAVQVKAVRIGDSPIAPLFEVVAKPNGWDRKLQQQVASQTGELSTLGQFRLAFWSKLLELYPDQSQWGPADAASSRWQPLKNSSLVVVTYISVYRCGIFVRGKRGQPLEESKALLLFHQEALEKRLGVPISDSEGYGLTQSLDADARDPTTWPKLAAWLDSRLQAYVEALEVIVTESLGTQP
ncbi:MAG: DUF4268 domain-containing protein [Cyanobium sp.]|uniref:hypothetical protein n=1 Tax=Synechococcus sp. CS-1333 TaxID=2848638 RepID=UPI000DBBECD9|nr:hypothetical protein [Synechococcus sp. CS-1333]MCT0210296.1 hypothetical protein [Synechococcus sp. CS-1333]PZV23311.1 MAG: DUF4268 domain-containing protein [Cyanobium sp.]